MHQKQKKIFPRKLLIITIVKCETLSCPQVIQIIVGSRVLQGAKMSFRLSGRVGLRDDECMLPRGETKVLLKYLKYRHDEGEVITVVCLRSYHVAAQRKGLCSIISQTS